LPETVPASRSLPLSWNERAETGFVPEHGRKVEGRRRPRQARPPPADARRSASGAGEDATAASAASGPRRPTRDERARASGRAGSSGRERGSRSPSRKTPDRRLPSGKVVCHLGAMRRPARPRAEARSPRKFLAHRRHRLPHRPWWRLITLTVARREVRGPRWPPRRHQRRRKVPILVRDSRRARSSRRPAPSRPRGEPRDSGTGEASERRSGRRSDEARDHQPAATRMKTVDALSRAS